MAYEPNTWKKGDIVTAQKLNHLEEGVASGSGVFVVDVNYDQQSSINSLAVKAGVIAEHIDADELIASRYTQQAEMGGITVTDMAYQFLEEYTTNGEWFMFSFSNSLVVGALSADDYPTEGVTPYGNGGG